LLEPKAQRIVEAAMELAEEGGFSAVRLRDVAARADVALGTLYARFQGKEEILLAGLEQATEAFETMLNQERVDGVDPQERLGVFFGIASQALFSRPHFAQAVVRATAAGEVGVASRIISYQERMSRMIVSAMQGRRPSEVEGNSQEPAFVLAAMLQSLGFGALVGWVSGALSEEQVQLQMRQAIRVVWAGRGATAPGQ
jgi:AcrR family transcriptional regulator